MSQTGTQPAVAERLYYDSPALQFSARVTDVRLVATEREANGDRAQVWQVSLDRTAFYPESGGQPWDTGTLSATARSGAVLQVPVERVEEDDEGEIWHFVRKPLVEGTEVTGQVDAERRIDHMQQHSGQHLLSAVLLQRLGATTVSFHLGAESATIDLKLRDGEETIAAGELEAVEDEVNRLIFENRSFAPRWHTRGEAEAMLARGELRKLPERSGPMRVVELQGVEFNACGGTHVTATGSIGGLLLRRLEKVKAGWRLEFLCGLRAVRASRREFAVLSAAAQRFSVGPAEVPERVAQLQAENKTAAKERQQLMGELADALAAELVATAQGSVITANLAGRPLETGKRIAAKAAASGKAVVVGGSEGGQGFVVLATPADGGVHAGDLLRRAVVAAGARGGGGPTLAQAVCPQELVPQLMQQLVDSLG